MVAVPILMKNKPGSYKKWFLLNFGVADSGKILSREENLAYQVGESKIPPVLELWIASRECFVLGQYYAKKARRQGIVDKLRKERSSVVYRSSGGEAILHDSTCLNFGVVVPRHFFCSPFDIGRAFITLSSGVVYYLKQMKIPVSSGQSKTFCPGPYDLLVEGKKIAGVSLLSRDNFCLVHGTLLVNSQREYFDKLKVFYPLLDEEATSLQILTGKWINMEQVIDGIIQGYRRNLNISFDPRFHSVS